MIRPDQIAVRSLGTRQEFFHRGAVVQYGAIRQRQAELERSRVR
ncbi:MAG: hypothetical protein ACI9CV_000679 [Ilumatobacter sp.]|jgi:hypothetical protein